MSINLLHGTGSIGFLKTAVLVKIMPYLFSKFKFSHLLLFKCHQLDNNLGLFHIFGLILPENITTWGKNLFETF